MVHGQLEDFIVAAIVMMKVFFTQAAFLFQIEPAEIPASKKDYSCH